MPALLIASSSILGLLVIVYAVYAYLSCPPDPFADTYGAWLASMRTGEPAKEDKPARATTRTTTRRRNAAAAASADPTDITQAMDMTMPQELTRAVQPRPGHHRARHAVA